MGFTNRHNTDRDHVLILDGLRKAGEKVVDSSGCGNGIADLTVNVDGVIVMLEIKTPGNVRYTKKEKDFHRLFQDTPLYTVTSLQEAIDRLDQVRRKYQIGKYAPQHWGEYQNPR